MKISPAILLLLACTAQAEDFCTHLDALANKEGISTDSTENVYKVTGKGRLQFYSAPESRCAMRGTFIIPGQQVYTYLEYKNYASVMYMADDQQVTGWVDKSRLAATHTGVGPDYNRQAANAQDLSAADFTVVIRGQKITLGEAWNNSTMQAGGKEEKSEFVGDVPFGESSYKFWQHHYSGYSIYSANLFWDRLNRSVDSYIIAQIDLNSPDISTRRGIKTGDSETQLTAAYGPGTVDNSDNQRWLSYDSDDKRLSFQIDNNRISHIMMVFKSDNQN